MKTLGVDWGEKRIGLALAEGTFAEPFGVASSFEEIKSFIQKEGVQKVVLGLPEGRHENQVRKFGKRIEEELRLKVIFRSEVLTTHLAQQKLIEAGKSRKDRTRLDAASAALLLQEYLDEQAANS